MTPARVTAAATQGLLTCVRSVAGLITGYSSAVPLLRRSIAQGCSEYNITVLIDQRDSVRALRAVHGRFYLATLPLGVGLVGPGLIGGTFLDQVHAQFEVRAHARARISGRPRTGAGVRGFGPCCCRGHVSQGPAACCHQPSGVFDRAASAVHMQGCGWSKSAAFAAGGNARTICLTRFYDTMRALPRRITLGRLTQSLAALQCPFCCLHLAGAAGRVRHRRAGAGHRLQPAHAPLRLRPRPVHLAPAVCRVRDSFAAFLASWIDSLCCHLVCKAFPTFV